MDIYAYRWLPDNGTAAKGVVQISHGLSETAARYGRFAASLTADGYAVYANDHRGHGMTAKTPELAGDAGENSFNMTVGDMRLLNDIIHEENPALPVFLFGHSMGSMLAQSYIHLYGDTISGCILSGTCGKQGLELDIGTMIAKREMRKIGPTSRSRKLNALMFGKYNDAFKPARTDFDWLSRDEQEVDKYVDDPFCGGVCSSEFYYYFLMGMKEIHRRKNMEEIPKTLPIYIFSGEKDPVGGNCKTVKWLIREYQNLGIKDVSHRFYPEGRHEMLNELNRDEVVADVIAWLNAHTADKARQKVGEV